MATLSCYNPIPERSYFMSQLEKDAEVGRAYGRLGEVEDEIKKLDLAATRVGNVLTGIATALKTNPGGLVFEKESYPSGFPEIYVLKQVDQKDVSVDAIRALVNDYRKFVAEKRELEGKLKAHG